MENSRNNQEVVLNLQGNEDSNNEVQQDGTKWMDKFEDSEKTLVSCYEILNSSIDDNVKLNSLKIIQNKTEYLKCPEDTFIIDLRDTMKQCLRVVFKLVSIRPYLNNALSIISSNQSDFSKIEACLFFISGMITDISVAEDFYDVLKLILTFRPDAYSILIKTSCTFLKDFYYHFPDYPNASGDSLVGFDSIFQWLARVPDPAVEINSSNEEFYKDDLSCMISDIEYTNNILVFCQEITDVQNLAQWMVDSISNNANNDDLVLLLESLVDFYSDTLLQVGSA
ncbi:hypothetical protein RF11_10064 [Thelohanellus kitauei]|uniref:Uncharacterized protein n=1 Tax=Thelohanellus kitauei TaxID=669202 RepID=A0A0C2J7T5_THEKT|nr:hypothetical protein RF11_10064 [Thelohanellus kitauei]